MIFKLFFLWLLIQKSFQQCEDEFAHNQQVCVIKPKIKYFNNVKNFCQEKKDEDIVPNICKAEECTEQQCECLHSCFNFDLQYTCNSSLQIFTKDQQELFCEQFCFTETEKEFHSNCDQKFCNKNFCELQKCLSSNDNLQVCSKPQDNIQSHLLNNEEYCRKIIQQQKCYENQVQINCNQHNCNKFQCLFENKELKDSNKHLCLWNENSLYEPPMIVNIEQYCSIQNSDNLKQIKCANDNYCTYEEECCLSHCMNLLKDDFKGTCTQDFQFIFQFEEYCKQRCLLNIAQCDSQDCNIEQCEKKKCDQNLVKDMCDENFQLVSSTDICKVDNYSQKNFFNCDNQDCKKKNCNFMRCIKEVKDKTHYQYLCLNDVFRPVYFDSLTDYCNQNTGQQLRVEDIIECDNCNSNQGCCVGACQLNYDHKDGCSQGIYYTTDQICETNCKTYYNTKLDICIFENCNQEKCQIQLQLESDCDQNTKLYCFNNGEVSDNICPLQNHHELKISFECPQNCQGNYRDQYCSYLCQKKFQIEKKSQLILNQIFINYQYYVKSVFFKFFRRQQRIKISCNIKFQRKEYINKLNKKSN